MRPGRELYRAEWRARRPLLPLAVLAGLLAPWLPWALSAAPPLEQLAGSLLLAGGPREHALQALLLLGLAWLTARQAFAGGAPQAPDELLRGLPLAPGLVFRARALSCLLVLGLALLLRQLLALGCALLLASELQGTATLGAGLGEAGVLLAGLGLGLRLVRWGGLGWSALLLLVLSGEELARTQASPALSLLALPGASAGELGAGLLLWALPAGLAAAWARVRFLGAEAPAHPGRGARLTLRLTGALALLSTASLALADRRSPADEPRVRFPRGRVTTRTARYLFTGLSPLPRPARQLIEGADAVHDRVAGLLGISLGPGERLRATLLEEGADAPPQAPRLPLRPGAPGDGPPPPHQPEPGAIPLELGRPGGPRLILAAATAEVLLDRRAGGRRDPVGRPPGWGVLRAGLVRHAAWRAAEVDPFWSRFHAAVLHARRPLLLDELLEPGRLLATRGRDAAPALGELLVAALARSKGEGTIPLLAAALCDHRALEGPRGVAEWRPVLQQLGTTPEELFQAVLELVEDTIPADPRAALSLPRLHALEDPQDQPGLRLVAVPDEDLPLGWEVLCRVAEESGQPPRRAVGLGRDAKGCWAFNVPDVPWGAELPRVQLGLRPPGDAPFREPIWEEWSGPP